MINIAIAEDHNMVRQGVIDFISSFEDFDVVIEASDGNELIDKLTRAVVLPDICILDISMPGLNGYETIKVIRKNWLSVKTLVFSAFYTAFSVTEMLGNGANGFLKKNSSPRQLQQALASVYYNDYYLSESITRELFNKPKDAVNFKITEREMEFLRHCCSELSYKEIGGLMNVSPRTIESFRDSLFTKFNLKTRAGLVLFALQNGIVCIEN